MPSANYEWREWDGEAVVFVHATGDTHALSAAATAVFAAMRSLPAEALVPLDWLQRAGQTATADDDDGETTMKGLAAVGLVEPAPR